MSTAGAASPADAKDFIYWPNLGPFATGSTIGRANLEGGEIDQSFTSGVPAPISVAVDKSSIYWSNVDSQHCTGSTIGRAELSGIDPDESFLAGVN